MTVSPGIVPRSDDISDDLVALKTSFGTFFCYFRQYSMGSSTVKVQQSSTDSAIASPPARFSSTLILLSFAAVYFIWGSTFFAIRIAVQSMPALLVPAIRHFSVGLIFYPLFRYLSKEKPTARQWATCVITGILLLTAGNGSVSWSETFVPSGLAALLVATVSLWMVLLDWLRPGGTRPSKRVFAGIVMGLLGVALLVRPGHSAGAADGVSLFGTVILVLASLAWAFGSIYSRHHPLPHSPLLGVAMQCLAGGGALLVATVLSGELKGFHWVQVSTRAWLAIAYLAVFGSAIGYSAYVYLLKHSSATSLSTYAFVNPVVALFLGWSFGGEAFSLRTLAASAVILSAVILVITGRHQPAALADDTVPAPGEA
jgi:drug/metabolite transporter (DMT)-like permease